MSTTYNILNDYMIEDWFDSQQYSRLTRSKYTWGMKKYCEFTGLSPEQLVLEAEEDIRKGLLPRERRIKQHLIKYRKKLTDANYAPKSIGAEMAAVKSFYRNFDIDIPNIGKKNHNVPLEQNKYIPDREVIRNTLELATIRNKAIILCGCSGGLGVNEIVNLRVGQFLKGYDPDTEITTLHMRRQKVQYDYITFLSPEASRAVKRYLDWRDTGHVDTSGPKRERTYAGRRVNSDADYLFVSDYACDTFLESRNEEDRKISTRAVMHMYRRFKHGRKNGNWGNIRSHNMRKYFNTSLLNAGADIFFVDFLMGHKISGTHEAYYRADPESLKKKYIKYLPFLAIEDTEVHTIESAEYRQLREQNEVLEAKVSKMETLMDDGINAAVAAEVAKVVKMMNPR